MLISYELNIYRPVFPKVTIVYPPSLYSSYFILYDPSKMLSKLLFTDFSQYM